MYVVFCCAEVSEREGSKYVSNKWAVTMWMEQLSEEQTVLQSIEQAVF